MWTLRFLPAEWKHAVVVPIHKAGKNPSLPLSYRPISLTSTLCKITEKMVNNRLRWFLETNQLVNVNQCGFRKNRCTTDQLIKLENEIKKSQINKDTLLAVFIDFEKAFDMMWRDGLLYKMKGLGINGNMYAFVKKNLQDRSLQVRIGGTYSDIHTIENGTPQGSCISPTIFSVAINDFNTCLTNKNDVSQFADDSMIYKIHRNLSYLCYTMSAELDKVIEWCDTWGFKISETKTVAILFKKVLFVSELEKLELTMGDIDIDLVDFTKFLGLYFDRHMTWSKHIDAIIEKGDKRLNLIKYLSGTDWGCDRYTLTLIYKTLIRSVVDYGCMVYQSASDTDLKKTGPIAI